MKLFIMSSYYHFNISKTLSDVFFLYPIFVITYLFLYFEKSSQSLSVYWSFRNFQLLAFEIFSVMKLFYFINLY